MKAIMISDKPKWCALMMNGDKTIEVRKNKALASAIQKLIDEYGYADIYVYCSKDNKGYLTEYCDKETNKHLYWSYDLGKLKGLNGKVLFKFRCYKVEEILITPHGNYYTNTLSNNKLQTQSCLSNIEIFKYTNCHITIYGYCVCGYAIHISDLEIFDKPKELSEFNHWTDKKIQWYSVGEKVKVMVSLTNAPQNYCYVEIGKQKYGYEINK